MNPIKRDLPDDRDTSPPDPDTPPPDPDAYLADDHERSFPHDEDAYLLDNQQVEAGQRFDALSALFNPSTYRHLQALGLTAGWQVWEVGAGGPSVPDHLAAQVGPGGHVLATDIDTSWLGGLAHGRKLPRLLREAGLSQVQSDAYFPMGGPACTELERATVEQVRERLVAAGMATDVELDQHLSNVTPGRLDLATSPMVSAWGRKPVAA